jgi:tetratricopeptide (TPR) repeat protein
MRMSGASAMRRPTDEGDAVESGLPADAAARWRRIEELFDGALAISREERDAYLSEACPDDPELRAAVMRMLVAHDIDDGILDLPAKRESRPSIPLDMRLAKALGQRYTIERELGRGGMAVVYLAHERKHARQVVIKVLRPEIGAFFGTHRFVREVHIAARLAHPHIVGLLDSGQAEGLLYYVMPYLEGETLRARLGRERPVPLTAALMLLRDIADALSHAHRWGVVHRDLKPENVLCAGDHAYLLDFGIAKLRARLSGDVHVTKYGLAVGTPAYMAPEQNLGSPVLDHRADIYSWGVLAYEILTGQLPQVSRSNIPRVKDALDVRAELPMALVTLVRSCLSPEADARPDDASALLDRLAAISGFLSDPAARAEVRPGVVAAAARLFRRARRHVLWSGSAAIAIASVAVGTQRSGVFTEAPMVPHPIAVAALVNETGVPALDVWGRMAGDWMTQGLQEVGVTTVVPWPTARLASEQLMAQRRQGRVLDPVVFLGEETGAGAVVTGAYYLAGDSLRFHLELTSTREGRSLGVLPPVVVQRDSGQLAVRQLRDRLMGAVALLADERISAVDYVMRRPPTFDAYRAFDHALGKLLDQEYGAAASIFREAQTIDSSFVVPLLYAATAYWNTGEFVRADSMLQTLGTRRSQLSVYHDRFADFLEAMLTSDGPRALAAIRTTAALAPQSRAAYDLALVALDMDRPHEALVVLERLNPDRGELRGWSSYWTQRTHALHLLGDHEHELLDARELRLRHPDRRVGMVLESRALAALGRHAALDTLFAQTRGLPSKTYWSQGAALVVAGEELSAHGWPDEGRRRLEQAVAWFEMQLAQTPNDRAHREWLGGALYALGRWSEAFVVFDSLRHEFPTRIKYRGMAALAATRAGRAGGEVLLGSPAAHETGTHLAFRARLTAIRGEPQRAVALLADGIRAGIGSLPWLHAEARVDLDLLTRVEAELPLSLRVPARAASRTRRRSPAG